MYFQIIHVFTLIIRFVVAAFSLLEVVTYNAIIENYLLNPCEVDETYCAKYDNDDDKDTSTDCRAFRKLYVVHSWLLTMITIMYCCITATQVIGQMVSCCSGGAKEAEQSGSVCCRSDYCIHKHM